MKPEETKVDRRQFIQLMAAGSVASIVPSIPAQAGSTSARDTRVCFPASSLPVLFKCDVLVYGGSLAGCAAALEFARSEKRVVLAECRTYLGRDLTTTLRPWITVDHGVQLDHLPAMLASMLETSPPLPSEGALLLRPAKIKLALEDALLKAGVELLFGSQPVQLLYEGGRASGAVFGNKSGRQVILANILLDCSESATLVHLTDAPFAAPDSSSRTCIRTLEFTQIDPAVPREIEVTKECRITGGRVRVHRGYCGPDHYYVECPLDLPLEDFGPHSLASREMEAWRRSMRVAAFLFDSVPQFKHSFLTMGSYGLAGFYSARMAPLSVYHDGLPLAVGETTTGAFTTGCFSTPCSNIWSLNESARLTPDQMDFFRHPYGACVVGTAFVKTLITGHKAGEEEAVPLRRKGGPAPDRSVEYREQESPQEGRRYELAAVPAHDITVFDEVEVLVAGGGTSGVAAALAAAEAGKRTMLVEMLPALGGTGTFGGVNDYWGKGRYTGFPVRYQKELEKIQASVPDYTKEGNPYWQGFVTWNIQAKTFMLLEECRKAKLPILSNAVIIGVVMEENRVRGVVVASRQGPLAILARQVIDATGDGDVAAFAGAPFVYGTAREHMPLWYSLTRFPKPGAKGTTFLSSVDISNIHDCTRSVLVGRRRTPSGHDHSIYLAPRESRHIVGKVTLTLTDCLRRRQWSDVVSIHYSNCDLKGYHTSGWIRMGLIPPNLDIEIPYRSMLPLKVENLIVTGKAISCRHESFAAIRMQADLENLGAVAGCAASLAVERRVAPRQLPLVELQQKLVSLQILPVSILARRIQKIEYAPEQLERLIKQFDPEKPLPSYSNMEMGEVWNEPIPIVEVCSSDPKVAIPLLEKSLGQAEGKQAERLAQALAKLGSLSAAPTLVDTLIRRLKDGALPPRSLAISHSDEYAPGQGAMPYEANLLYSLGMTACPQAITVWNRVAEIFAPQEKDLLDNKKGLFYYVDAVCYGAELLADHAALPALEKLHSCPFLRQQSRKSGIELDFALERRAMLEIILGRALARCGSLQGYDILVEYLDDMRANLAEFAHLTLRQLTAQDHGKDKQAWREWLQRNGAKIVPVKLTEREDG